ncbi:MAG: HAMP domain-containing protein [Deltaproteobacteria bacterium]|nr:HAMP domain-containing protein [Deltaproteobacteria bacterium]
MKFTIFKRLTFGYLAIMMLVLFLVIFVTIKLNQLMQLTRAASSVDGQTVRLTERLSNNMFSMVGFEKKYLISRDNDFYRRFLRIKNDFNTDLQQLRLLMAGSEKNKKFSETRGLCDKYFSIFTSEIENIKKGRRYAYANYQTQKEKIIEKINKNFKEINWTARSDRDEKIQISSQISYNVFITTSIAAGLSIFFGILISFFNTRTINRSILLLQKKTNDIAEGKFEKISGIDSPPEIKELANDFNIMCDRLRELDELKEDFISHVSHELRTPLTAIREASGLLIEGAFADEPKSSQELLTIVKDECERLIVSVNRILDLSRMEAKMMDYHFNRVSLIYYIRKCLLKLAPIAKRKNIILKLRRQKHLPDIRMDTERIIQLLDNLVGNALKFTDKGGSVIVEVLLKNHARKMIQVSISDTGCGIHKENMENIFKKFKRIECGQNTARGTGLGLSIAKYVITAHGGEIWVESTLGKGSTFFFSLPAA